MTLEEALRTTEDFLTGQMVESLKATEYALPAPSAEPAFPDLRRASRARVELAHVRGASDAVYRVHAFGDVLTMQVQLNVRRFVVVYRLPVLPPADSAAVAPHFERWAIGAGHAGWQIGWRDAADPGDPDRTFVETYAYAMCEPDLLSDPLQQLYWRTDIVQMTRAFMLEAHRARVTLRF
jgi:hypothetical protein